ncbi:MAG: hypothetical protein ACKOOE_01070 [Micrococcales bacterium]
MTIKKSALALFAGVLLAGASVVPANATAFSVSADRTSGLTAAGDTVNVTLTGVPADQGVYVRLCKGTLAEVSQARPTQCFGQGAWVSLSATQQQYGAGNAANPVALAVQAQFDSVDCTVDACGIHIRRDHNGGSSDYSLDRFIPVTFGSPTVSAPAPTNSVARAHGKISFTIVNKKGKTVTVWVGARKVVKKITSNNFVVTVPASSAAWYQAVAYVGGVKVLSKKFNN